MRKIPQDAVVIFIGRRRTGKSTLVRDLLFHHQEMPLGTVISGTEESNSFYGKMIPPLFIHGEFSPDYSGQLRETSKDDYGSYSA